MLCQHMQRHCRVIIQQLCDRGDHGTRVVVECNVVHGNQVVAHARSRLFFIGPPLKASEDGRILPMGNTTDKPQQQQQQQARARTRHACLSRGTGYDIVIF